MATKKVKKKVKRKTAKKTKTTRSRAASKTTKKAKTTKAPLRKKKKVTKSKTSAASRTSKTPPSMPKGTPFRQPELHGVQLSTGDPKRSKRGVVALLDIKQIKVMQGFNPRGHLGDLKELAKSIKSEGVLQSLVVRPGKKQGTFDLIAGERRLKACQALSYKHPIPCLIRMDLVGDDDRALAVAVAENSEDGRVNLNMIELGRVAKKLEGKKWTVARTATETGLDPKRIRRALELQGTPAEVQKNVVDGKWSVQAGLEYAKLDPTTRKKIASKLDEAVTAADIKRARLEADKETRAVKVAKGVDPSKTKRGKTATRPQLVIWRGSREKQAMLQECCHIIVTAEPKEVGSKDFLEMRACASTLMWDRGDRSLPAPPDLQIDPKDKDAEAKKKDLAAFEALVQAEAAKFKVSTA